MRSQLRKSGFCAARIRIFNLNETYRKKIKVPRFTSGSIEINSGPEEYSRLDFCH